MVFADIRSILKWEGRALGECRRIVHRPFIVVACLLALAPPAYSGGKPEGDMQDRLLAATQLIAEEQSGLTLPPEFADLSAEEVLDRVDQLISEGSLSDAVELLSGLVTDDPLQLERAEELFRAIRDRNRRYVEKGEEVRERLQELLSEDLAEDELVQTAVEALALIAEMEEIIPNPNPQDAEIVNDLRYTVQLNIDRRRFENLMDAAAERLAASDYAGASDIYVNGLEGILGVPAVDDETDAGEEAATGSPITFENGVDIQRRFFEERDYGLLGERVVSARESLREVGNAFIEVGPEALQVASELGQTYSQGDFTAAEAQVETYLDLLTSVTEFAVEVETAGEVLLNAEEVTSAEAREDPARRVDWHIRFLRDITLGRPGATSPEGLQVVVDTVRNVVEADPVAAARSYGESRYLEARSIVEGIEWPADPTGFAGVGTVETRLEEADSKLIEAAESYATFSRILSVSRLLGITTPVPPETVPAIGDGSLREAWNEYQAGVASVVAGTDTLGGELQTNVDSANVMAAASSFMREHNQRSIEALDSASSRRSTILSLQAQREAVQSILGRPESAVDGTLRDLLARAEEFDSTVSGEAELDDLTRDAVDFNLRFLGARVEAVELYELGIVEDIARIQYNGLSSRLSSLRTRTDTGEQQLEGITERVTSVDENGVPIRDEDGNIVTFVTTRRYPDRARDTLSPMVGRTSGNRIVTTSTGELQALLTDARDFVNRYANELPYIRAASTIQSEVARGREIVETLGEATGEALFGRARELLQRALDDLAEAEAFADLGEERVAEIRDLIAEARAANEAEDLDTAGQALGLAGTLLKSDDPQFRDASDLFADSLATWYRPEVAERWNEQQADLNDQIALAQADIVITRVQQAVREAQPLVEEQRWADARDILQNAENLWSDVFPTTVYPPLVRLLRFVETALAKQNERVLREDDPDYDKLAPLLSRATQAMSEDLYEEAAQLVEQFLRALPNNIEARLLEVDIALEEGTEDLTTKVNRLIANSLPDGAQRSDLENLEAADALELQSLLIAILDRLEERSDVSGALLARLRSEIDTLEEVLSPQPVLVATADIRAESNAIVDRSLANGPLETLSKPELEDSLGLLEEALEVDPTNARAIDLLSLALRLPNAPRRDVLDATEQQIVRQARDLFSRGSLVEALRLVEQLWADPDNRNDTELNRFREELLDAIRRGT